MQAHVNSSAVQTTAEVRPLKFTSSSDDMKSSHFRALTIGRPRADLAMDFGPSFPSTLTKDFGPTRSCQWRPTVGLVVFAPGRVSASVRIAASAVHPDPL